MKFIRVDMSRLAVHITGAPAEYGGLGGRAVTSGLIAAEVHPRCHPLGPANKLVIAPGLLTGSAAPCSGRTSIGAKSPLTGAIKESNVGGRSGQYLACHGIKALVVEGVPADGKTRVLVINGEGAYLEEKPQLAGLGNYDLTEALAGEYGSNCAFITIGPAGEKKAAVATVAVNDLEGRPSRHAGRGGMGAVMGSKGLKAIIIDRPALPLRPPASPGPFKEMVREFAEKMQKSKKALHDYGTAVLVNAINESGGLPTRNFSTGKNEMALEISGETLNRLCSERGGTTGHPCSRGCAIRCSNTFHDENGNYLTSALEYETIALLGSNCGLNKLDAIAVLDRLCDDLGMDTMEMGITLGVAMEGGLLPFGDFSRMKDCLKEVVAGTVLGRVLGQGAVITGRVLGVQRVPAVMGQGLPAYDPRSVKGTGVTCATSTMGADHTAGNCLPGRGGIDCHKAEGQINLSRVMQELSGLCDILGMCIFVGPVPETLPDLVSMTGAFSGDQTNAQELVERAKQMLKTEAAFNEGAGVGKGQHHLPLYFRTEPLPNNGLVFDVPPDEMEELARFAY